jgi:phosphoenolpyruvate carboxykinase (ATP)
VRGHRPECLSTAILGAPSNAVCKDAIHSGELAKAKFEVYGTFDLQVPISVSGVPSEILNPQISWKMGEVDFKKEVMKLAKLFLENFKKYGDEATPDVINAGEYI